MTLVKYLFRFGSVHGEELAYVLGMPLVGGTYHFVHNYTHQVMPARGELAKVEPFWSGDLEFGRTHKQL